jgi:hypothetical protein
VPKIALTFDDGLMTSARRSSSTSKLTTATLWQRMRYEFSTALSFHVFTSNCHLEALTAVTRATPLAISALQAHRADQDENTDSVIGRSLLRQFNRARPRGGPSSDHFLSGRKGNRMCHKSSLFGQHASRVDRLRFHDLKRRIVKDNRDL